jgi:hypothetical protein
MVKSRRMRWVVHVAKMGVNRNAYRLLVEEPGGKRPLGRPRQKLLDNIQMNLREEELGDMDWIDIAQNRDQWRVLVNMLMDFRVS